MKTSATANLILKNCNEIKLNNGIGVESVYAIKLPNCYYLKMSKLLPNIRDMTFNPFNQSVFAT